MCFTSPFIVCAELIQIYCWSLLHAFIPLSLCKMHNLPKLFLEYSIQLTPNFMSCLEIRVSQVIWVLQILFQICQLAIA